MRTRRARWGVILILLALVAAGCTYSSTAADETAVCVGGGPIEGKGVKQVLSPDSGNTFVGMMDSCHTYPTSLRVYDASSEEGADGDPIVAPSSDGVEMQFSVRVRFKLNTGECEISGGDGDETEPCIQQFHEEVGNRYGASGGEDSDGWDRMLAAVFRGELDTTIQRIARQHSAVSLAFDGETLNSVEEELQDGLRTQINESVDGQFFCGPGHEYGGDSCPEFEASITVIRPHREETRTAFEAVQQEAARTRAAEQQIDTATAEAQARQIVQQSLEGGNSEALVLLEAIESGSIQFWVIPSDGGLSLTTPTPQQ
jgi:hypothetical protein